MCYVAAKEIILIKGPEGKPGNIAELFYVQSLDVFTSVVLHSLFNYSPPVCGAQNLEGLVRVELT